MVRTPQAIIIGTLLGSILAGPCAAQTPPTATEAFALRIECKKMADAKAEELRWHPLSVADGTSTGMSAAAVEALNRQTKPEVVFDFHSSKIRC